MPALKARPKAIDVMCPVVPASAEMVAIRSSA